MEEASGRTSAFWARTPEARRREQITNWMEHPYLMSHTSRRITGAADGEYWRWAIDCALTKPVDRVLSIGCGGGELERRMLTGGWARHITAIDVSPGAVDEARAAAEAAGLEGDVEYRVADVNGLALESGAYDLVIAQQSLHHVTALEDVASQIAQALCPGGALVLNEYFGPSRFQLPDRQLEAINTTLSRIPKRFRARSSDGSTKTDQPQFDLAWFDANDPSEAVRSDEIMDVFGERFSFPEVRPYGGGLLQFLLDDIVGSFNGPRGRRWIGRLAEREIQMEQHGVIDSDFLVAIGRPRP